MTSPPNRTDYELRFLGVPNTFSAVQHCDMASDSRMLTQIRPRIVLSGLWSECRRMQSTCASAWGLADTFNARLRTYRSARSLSGKWSAVAHDPRSLLVIWGLCLLRGLSLDSPAYSVSPMRSLKGHIVWMAGLNGRLVPQYHSHSHVSAHTLGAQTQAVCRGPSKRPLATS